MNTPTRITEGLFYFLGGFAVVVWLALPAFFLVCSEKGSCEPTRHLERL